MSDFILHQSHRRKLKNFDPLINAFCDFKLKALSSASKLKAIAKKWTSDSVKEYKDRRIISSVTASSSIVSGVALGCCMFLTGPFLPIAVVAGVAGAGCGITQGIFDYKYQKLAKTTILEVEKINKELEDALDEIKKCIEDIMEIPTTTDDRYLDRLLDEITSDDQFRNNVPKIRMLHMLVVKVYQENLTSLSYLANAMQHVGKISSSASAEGISMFLKSNSVKSAGKCTHPKFDMKCTSTPPKSATISCLSKFGKVMVFAGLLGDVVSAGLSIKDACNMTAILDEIKKLPKDQQAKAANALSKSILEEAERIEEEVERLFIDFDVKKVTAF